MQVYFCIFKHWIPLFSLCSDCIFLADALLKTQPHRQSYFCFSATSLVLFPDTILAEQRQNPNASISCLYLNQ